MSEELQKKMQTIFRSIYEAIDLKYMRPIKRDMFKCAYDCLSDDRGPREAEQCIDDCGSTLNKAMSVVQDEMSTFQNRIDRCLMDCQDSVRTVKEESKARETFNSCADKCAAKFSAMVPEISATMCKRLEEIKQGR